MNKLVYKKNNKFNSNLLQVFDPLRRTDPEFFKKVSLIAGDCKKPDLGLSELDRAMLINEVEFIFHCAANTKLDATLREATAVNVRATRDLLNIAKEVENLKVNELRMTMCFS